MFAEAGVAYTPPTIITAAAPPSSIFQVHKLIFNTFEVIRQHIQINFRSTQLGMMRASQTT
jgi:hypothetical protein